MSEPMTIFGAGYVGLVAAVCFASEGHQVRVAEVDEARLSALRGGVLPFVEPGLEALLTDGLASGRLSFLHPDELDSVDTLVFVAVGTPSSPAGAADLRSVHDVVGRVLRLGGQGTVLVMKSTVPPGTGRALAAELAAHGIAYVSNPEFLREGRALEDWRRPDRIVLGGDPEPVARVAGLYASIDAPILTCDVASAELVKYASNAFLATKISFTNEIAALCDLLDADVGTVSHAVGLDRRIGTDYLRAGIGYGGSCFPKDARALDFLSMLNGYEFHLLKAVIAVNARQRMLPAITLRRHFGGLAGVRVAVLGLTFKPDTDDTRESPSAEIIDQLLLGGASVVAYDPVARLDRADEGFSLAASLAEAVAGANAVVLATEWPQFAHADWAALAASMAPGALVFDGRNCLPSQAVREGGAAYVGVGRR